MSSLRKQDPWLLLFYPLSSTFSFPSTVTQVAPEVHMGQTLLQVFCPLMHFLKSLGSICSQMAAHISLHAP